MQDKLEFLLALAKEKHFGHAAASCGVSQPNFSLAIKQLENTLGVPLVDRGARFLGFTPEGRRVLEWARRIVGDTRSMMSEIETMKKGLTGHLRLAVIPTALPLTIRFTSVFMQNHPDVRITVSSGSSSSILSMIDNLDADAGITYLGEEPIGRTTEVPLYSERHHLVTAETGALADRATVTWEEVSALPLCLLSADMQNRRILDRIFQEAGCTVRPRLETGSIMVLASYVRAGRCSTILPRPMVEELALPPEVRTIPIVAPEASSLVGLVVARRDPLPPLTAAFAAEVRSVAEDLV